MSTLSPPSAREGFSSSVAELRTLLAGEVLTLYQNNPFRVLNIPTDSTPSQAQKRAQKLAVWRQMGETVADEFLVRDALQTLRDPQKRLLAELFWFHTDAFDAPDSPNALALEKIKSGDWQQSQQLWQREARDKPDQESGWRALHNLAILLHARAVTIEAGKNPLIKTLKGNQALPDGHLNLWRDALAAWRKYLMCEAAWKHWKARAFDIGDKRMTPQFVAELRALLPEVLLQINRDLARRYVDGNFGLAAGAHCRLMLESRLDDEVARAFCRTVLDPLKKRVLATCETFKERVSPVKKDNAGERDWMQQSSPTPSPLALSQKFAGAMRNVSGLLLQIDPEKKYGAQPTREGVAQALKAAALAAGSEKKFADCTQIIGLALSFADSPSLQKDLQETRSQAGFLRDVWSKATPHCFMCSRRPDDWTIFTARNSGQRRLVFLCATHAKVETNAQSDWLLPHVDAKWNSLPIAPPEPMKIGVTPYDSFDDDFTDLFD